MDLSNIERTGTLGRESSEAGEQKTLPKKSSLSLSADQRIPKAFTPHSLRIRKPRAIENDLRRGYFRGASVKRQSLDPAGQPRADVKAARQARCTLTTARYQTGLHLHKNVLSWSLLG